MVKKLRKLAIVYKNGDWLQNSSVGKFGTSGPQNSRCGKCCEVFATKTFSLGFVLSQSTFPLVQLRDIAELTFSCDWGSPRRFWCSLYISSSIFACDSSSRSVIGRLGSILRTQIFGSSTRTASHQRSWTFSRLIFMVDTTTDQYVKNEK